MALSVMQQWRYVLAVVTTLSLLACGLGNESALLDGGDDQPPCCGCLCADERWSCSIETCLDESGRAVSLEAETGYLEIEQSYPAKERRAGREVRERVWYAFFPAEVAGREARGGVPPGRSQR